MVNIPPIYSMVIWGMVYGIVLPTSITQINGMVQLQLRVARHLLAQLLQQQDLGLSLPQHAQEAREVL